MLITNHVSITFFKTREAAEAIAKKGDMTEAGGFFVVPSTARIGHFVIECRDTDDGKLLGYL